MRLFRLGAIMAASAALAMPVIAQSADKKIAAFGEVLRPVRSPVRKSSSSNALRKYSSHRKFRHPKRHANRLHIRKRVRRAHRRMKRA